MFDNLEKSGGGLLLDPPPRLLVNKVLNLESEVAMLIMCNDCAEVNEVDEYEVGLTMCPCGSTNLEVLEADDVDVGDELDQDDELEMGDELEMDGQVEEDDEVEMDIHVEVDDQVEMGDQVEQDDELDEGDQVD